MGGEESRNHDSEQGNCKERKRSARIETPSWPRSLPGRVRKKSSHLLAGTAGAWRSSRLWGNMFLDVCTREHNVHVHLVVHVRKKEDEHKIPGKLDIKGTGAITDMVDNVFIWWRNKLKEDAATNGKINKNDTDAVLNVVKQRETGEEPLYGFYFHRGSCQFLDGPDDGPKNYLN